MAWPSTLPAPLLQGYSVSPHDATIRTDMDGGPARVRRRFTAVVDTVPVSFYFTKTQMADFRAYWEGDLAYGSAWFDMSIQDGRTGGSVTRSCRFVGTFSAEFDGSGWKVSCQMEVRLA